MLTPDDAVKYQIVYADPPWDYMGQTPPSTPTTTATGSTEHGGAKSSSTGAAATHYSTMKLSDLKRLDVPAIVDANALLFLWSSSPHLDQAIDLLPSWGFHFVTVGFVWDKQRVNPGYYTMSQCELCLIAKKGKIPTPRGARNVRQMVTAPRGEHSEKPDEVRNRISLMFPTQKKIELFARKRTPGWHTWGNEVESDVTIKGGLT